MAIEETKGEPGEVETEKKLVGLGGWLILVAIGLIISPIRLLLEVVPLHLAIVVDQEAWTALAEVSGWVPLFTFEVLGNLALLFFQVYLIVLFFLKKHSFPKLFIWVSIGSLAFSVTDVLLAGLVFPELIALDRETVMAIARPLVSTAIWVPYMIKSRRVKATFVR